MKMLLHAAAFALLLPAVAAAEGYRVGDLTITNPLSRETPSTAMAGAGYMTITNTGTTADRLVAVRADFPRVEIHDVKVENDVASMFRLDGVDIAPGETVTLQPGQTHVMFMGLNGDALEPGEQVSATLVFEDAGEVDILFDVQTTAAIMEAFGPRDGGEAHKGN